MNLGNRTLHPVLQRLAALVILGVGLGAIVAAVAAPLADAWAEHRLTEQRLDRFEGLLQAPQAAGPRYDPQDLSALHADDAQAQIALQSALDRIAPGARVGVQSVNPMPAEFMGDVGSSVWTEITLACDLEAMIALLRDIDAERPVLLVRRLEIDRGEGSRPDAFLRVRLETGRLWRTWPTTP